MNHGNQPDVTAAAKAFAIANPKATGRHIHEALVRQGIPNRKITKGVLQYARSLGKKAAVNGLNGRANGHVNGLSTALSVDEVNQCSMELIASVRRYGRAVFAKSVEFVSQLGIDRTTPVS